MDMNLHVIHDAETHRDLDEAGFGPRAKRSEAAAERPAFATAWYHDAAIEDARRDAIEAHGNPYSAMNLPRH